MTDDPELQIGEHSEGDNRTAPHRPYTHFLTNSLVANAMEAHTAVGCGECGDQETLGGSRISIEEPGGQRGPSRLFFFGGNTEA